jgi:hypothetical protein
VYRNVVFKTRVFTLKAPDVRVEAEDGAVTNVILTKAASEI